MTRSSDARLVAFCRSETRVSVLGALANSEIPLTGYRVAKVTGIQPIKVYRELDRATISGLVVKSARGFMLADPDIRALLRKRIRVSWSESWFAEEGLRAERASKIRGSSIEWFDYRRYQSNPLVARRYAVEIERPPEKDSSRPSGDDVVSRKRK